MVVVLNYGGGKILNFETILFDLSLSFNPGPAKKKYRPHKLCYTYFEQAEKLDLQFDVRFYGKSDGESPEAKKP